MTMFIEGLSLPAPGEQAIHRQHMNGTFLRDLNQLVPAYTESVKAGSLEELAAKVEAQYAPVAASMLVALTTEIVGALPYQDWAEMTMHPSRLYGSSTMSPHRDDYRDVRIVVEGDESVWGFREDPDGGCAEKTKLTRGDIVVLNNLCEYPERLKHNVHVPRGVRNAYRFSFSPDVSSGPTVLRTPMG